MNKFFARIFAVLAVLGLALGAISCNKDGNKIKIDYVGYATPVPDRLFSFL